MKENKTEITFRKASFQDLEKIVTIKKKLQKDKFKNWFSYKYEISKTDNIFLQTLIELHELYLPTYNENQLKMKFLSPILNKINFFFDDIKDWYDYPMSAIVNGTLLKGRPDFMVAKGSEIPQNPYFFIQEFKQIETIASAKDQLLAEMLAAMEINKKTILHGGYIIGQDWKFVILEKLKNQNYEYFVSKQFDCLDIDHLRQIYINLQAVKILFCKD